MEPEGEAAGVIDIERIAIGRKKQGEGRQGCLGVEWSLFLDGPEGKIFHFLQAYWYRFLVDAKIYECEKKGTKMKPQGDLKA